MRLSAVICSALTIGILMAMSFEIHSCHLIIGGRQKKWSPIKTIHVVLNKIRYLRYGFKWT